VVSVWKEQSPCVKRNEMFQFQVRGEGRKPLIWFQFRCVGIGLQVANSMVNKDDKV